MKKLNIELNVRCMDAKSILTTSLGAPDIEMGSDATEGTAATATRTATPMPGSFRN